MGIKLVSYKDIDKEKWGNLVTKINPVKGQYASYWYISAVTNKWSAFVLDDYIAAFPFAHVKKKGFDLVYQPFYSRNFPFLGESNDEFIYHIFQYFNNNYKHLDLNLFRQINLPFLNKSKRVFQQLSLKDDYKTIQLSFSKNAIRILKKNQNLKVKTSSNLDSFITLFKTTVGEKLNYKTENYNVLSSLINNGLKENCIEFLKVECDGEVHAYGAFYFHKNVINFLKGAVTNKGKKTGAMFVLIDYMISKNCSSNKIFDFGGSNIENVSEFYKKFGSEDVLYYNYSFDNLPVVVKKLKNIRTRFLK